jgi:hypothetical protein
MFLFFSNRLGCLGSVAVSAVLSLILIFAMRACNRPPSQLETEEGIRSRGANTKTEITALDSVRVDRAPKNL